MTFRDDAEHGFNMSLIGEVDQVERWLESAGGCVPLGAIGTLQPLRLSFSTPDRAIGVALLKDPLVGLRVFE